MSIDEAIEELATLYVGPAGERAEAASGLKSALAKGLSHAKVEDLMRRAEDDNVSLEDFVWNTAIPPEELASIIF